MPQPLTARIRGLRRRLRRRKVLVGVCTVVAVVLAAAIIVGAIDFVVRIEDLGLRIIASMAVFAAFVFAAGRYLIGPLRQRQSDVALARRMEALHPALGDLLSNGVAFARESETAVGAGSAALRRAVVAQATAAGDELSWDGIVSQRPLRRALAALGGVLAVLVAVVLMNRPVVQTAAARLLRPLGSDHWPRTNELVLRDVPSRVALGSPLEIEVTDASGTLPDRVLFHCRMQRDGVWQDDQRPMTIFDDVAVLRLDEVLQPLEFRVTGGDDETMPWRAVDVVEPPRLRALAVTLHPPVYTGYPPLSSQRHIRAIEGTRIELSGESSEPIRMARLVTDDGDPLDAALEKDGYHFSIPHPSWTATESTAYWFELTDAEGLVGGGEQRYAVRVTPDSPPTVSFEEMTGDRFVTAQATLPLCILVKDNLAIRRVSLVFIRSDQSDAGEQRRLLHEGPTQVPAKPDGADPTRDPGERQMIEFDWNLSELELPTGTDLLVHAEASDYRPSVGQTASPLRVSIISPEELEDRLAQRHGLIISELARALRMEREAREGVRAVAVGWQELGELRTAERDQLQTVIVGQQQVDRMLTDADDGVPRQIAELLDQIDSNRIDNPEMTQRLEQLSDSLRQLGRNELPQIRSQLTTAVKASQRGLAADTTQHEPDRQAHALADQALAAAEAALGAAGTGQDRVIETLQQLTDDLEQWAGYRRFARELGQLRNDQRQLAKTVQSELGLGVDKPDQPERQRRVDLKKSAEHQQEIARRLDAIGPRMAQVIEQIDERDPLAADALSDGLHLLRKRGIGGTMRDAGRSLENDRVGQALEKQAQAAADLEEVLDTLQSRRETQLGRLVKKLREAEMELAALREELAGLREKAENVAADEKSDREEKRRELEQLMRQLVEERQALEKEIERMARQLKRLTADRASRTTARAADSLAGKQGQPSPGGNAGSAEDLRMRAENAQKDLEEAQAQLADARRKAEQDLADEERARFAANLQALIGQQQHVLDETQRLETARLSTGQLSDGQRRSVRDLAAEQGLVRDETTDQAEKIGGIGVMRLALRRAADSMEQAATRLADQLTGEETQTDERNALGRLEQVLAALTPPDDDPDSNNDQKNGVGGGGQGAGQGCQPSIELAELKLLRQMQQDLHDRTAELESRLKEATNPDEDAAAAFRQAGDEQAQLAELVFALIDRDAEADERSDDPDGADDSLPDLETELEQDLDLPPLDISPFGPSPPPRARNER